MKYTIIVLTFVGIMFASCNNSSKNSAPYRSYDDVEVYYPPQLEWGSLDESSTGYIDEIFADTTILIPLKKLEDGWETRVRYECGCFSIIQTTNVGKEEDIAEIAMLRNFSFLEISPLIPDKSKKTQSGSDLVNKDDFMLIAMYEDKTVTLLFLRK